MELPVVNVREVDEHFTILTSESLDNEEMEPDWDLGLYSDSSEEEEVVTVGNELYIPVPPFACAADNRRIDNFENNYHKGVSGQIRHSTPSLNEDEEVVVDYGLFKQNV